MGESVQQRVEAQVQRRVEATVQQVTDSMLRRVTDAKGPSTAAQKARYCHFGVSWSANFVCWCWW